MPLRQKTIYTLTHNDGIPVSLTFELGGPI